MRTLNPLPLHNPGFAPTSGPLLPWANGLPFVKSDQPAGNSRPLIPTLPRQRDGNEIYVRLEPRSRFLYRISGYPQWSVRGPAPRPGTRSVRDHFVSPQILDFATRLSTATSSHVSELSAQLAILRKKFVDACSFLPPYDQRQYDMVPISPSALDVIIDVWCSATKIVGTSFGEAADEPDPCGNQAKVCV